MTKTKHFLLAVISVIMSVLMCLMPVFSKTAFADESPQVYEKLYYFSDNPNCVQRFNGYINACLQEYDSLIDDITPHNTAKQLVNLSSYDQESLRVFLIANYSGQDMDLGNSFIIFELTQIKVTPQIALLLTDLFQYNKENNNCKIMFISGTDEAYLGDYYDENGDYHELDAFLDYVDIHINVDVFFDFFINVLYYAGGNGGVQLQNAQKILENCAFIFDYSFYSDPSAENLKYNFVISQIYDYMLWCYIDDINQDSTFFPSSMRDVFNRYNVNLLFYIGEGEYYDAVGGCVLDVTSTDDFEQLQDMLRTTSIHAVGTSWLGYAQVNEFFQTTTTLVTNCGVTGFNKYFYNPDALTINFSVYEAGRLLYYFESILQQIITDFITGEDLSGYDNISSGRCQITYKPIIFGQNGWMYDIGRNGSWYPSDDNGISDDENNEDDEKSYSALNLLPW